MHDWIRGTVIGGYLNRLLMNGVTVLCDVRRNPLSRKYGFFKRNFVQEFEGIGIRYEHLPELGIATEQRRAGHPKRIYECTVRGL